MKSDTNLKPSTEIHLNPDKQRCKEYIILSCSLSSQCGLSRKVDLPWFSSVYNVSFKHRKTELLL